MENKQRLAEYRICQQRGHVASGISTASNPTWQICRQCSTYFRYERVLREMMRPEGADDGD